MKVISTVKEWKSIRPLNKTIGLVATMGNLHLGHASLLNTSKLDNEITVLSIFINPTQFDNAEDLVNYPRTLEADLRLAENLKVDYVLTMNYEELYPDGFTYSVSSNSALTNCLEGAFRPKHFTGMLTVVLKLLLLTRPNRAYFGEKDYQQLMLVKAMAAAFLLDTKIVASPTIRNDDGLPLSSRNNRLSAEDLKVAALFSKLLSATLSTDEIKDRLVQAGFVIDYVEDYDGRRFGAVRLGNVRLIDNC